MEAALLAADVDAVAAARGDAVAKRGDVIVVVKRKNACKKLESLLLAS